MNPCLVRMVAVGVLTTAVRRKELELSRTRGEVPRGCLLVWWPSRARGRADGDCVEAAQHEQRPPDGRPRHLELWVPAGKFLDRRPPRPWPVWRRTLPRPDLPRASSLPIFTKHLRSAWEAGIIDQ